MAFEGHCGNCIDFKDKDDDNKAFNTRWANYEKGHCVRYGSFYWADDTCSRQKDRDKYQPSLCYITTIVCDILGFGDDCGVLQTLRKLRDDVMQKDQEYSKLLYEYDIVGPKIAEKLKEEKNTELATSLYNFYLLPTAQLVNNNEYQQAISRYKEMTDGLKECYGITEEYNMPKDYDNKKGGHGVVYTKKLV